jgi:hypothetical protein
VTVQLRGINTYSFNFHHPISAECLPAQLRHYPCPDPGHFRADLEVNLKSDLRSEFRLKASLDHLLLLLSKLGDPDMKDICVPDDVRWHLKAFSALWDSFTARRQSAQAPSCFTRVGLGSESQYCHIHTRRIGVGSPPEHLRRFHMRL